MVTTLKRKYETAIIKEHPGALPDGGYSIIEEHLGTAICRGALEGYQCVFCRVLHQTGTEEDHFAELVERWRRGTGGLSSPKAITGHLAYQQIIQMGKSALPMIFRELQENGGWWYPALRALAGENPVPAEAKGRPPLNREAWLEWGRRNGYLQS